MVLVVASGLPYRKAIGCRQIVVACFDSVFLSADSTYNLALVHILPFILAVELPISIESIVYLIFFSYGQCCWQVLGLCRETIDLKNFSSHDMKA